jgi:hypothetical protein
MLTYFLCATPVTSLLESDGGIICDFIKGSFPLRVVMVVDMFDYYYSKAPLIAFPNSDYYDL